MQKEQNSKLKSKKSWTFDKMALYALVFLMPTFFLTATLSPVGINKQLFAGTLLIALLIYVLAKFLASGKITLPPKHLSITALAVFIAVLLAGLFSQARSISFFSTTPDSVFWVGTYVVAFFAGVVSLRSVKSIKTLSVFYLAGMVLVSVISVLQLVGIFIFPFSFSKDVGFNPVGSVFAFGFLLAAALVAVLTFLNTVRVDNKKVRVILWTTALFFTLILLQINLWSIWLAIAIAAVLTVLVAGSKMVAKKDATLKPLFIPFGMIMISLFFIIVGAQFPTFIANTAEVGLSLDRTVDIAGKSMSAGRWAVGTGPGTFAYNYSLHRPLEINQTDFWGVRFGQGHSALSTYISTLGIPAVLLVLIFLGMFFVSSLKGSFYASRLTSKKDSKDNFLNGIALGAIGVAAVLAAAMFVYKGNVVLHLFLFMAMGVALSSLIKLGAVAGIKLDMTKKPQVMIISSLAALLVISGAFGGLYILGQRYVAQVYLAQAVKNYQENQDLNQAIDKLQRALDTNSSDDSILRVTSQALVLRLGEIINSEDLTEQEISTQFENTLRAAVSVSTKATKLNPKDVQNWEQLGVVYGNLIGFVDGAAELAVNAYEEARVLDPNNPSLPLAVARVYLTNAYVLQNQLSALTQGQDSSVQLEQELVNKRTASLNRSVEYIEEALRLKPDYISASFLLASAYQRLGELDKAIIETEQLARIAPRDPNMAFQLGLLYYQNDEFEKAVVELERSISLASDQFANARYYLGLTYNQLNRGEDAIRQFERLSQDNPGNQLVERILNNLRSGRGALEDVLQPDTTPPIEDTGGAEDEPPLPF
ncbi:MAG: tetratricopeptide repeat protein [Candidatus Spechtbacterales bacterium]